MAEERNVGVARAPEADEDTTKAELQRRMEEARESITQTVTEIKDTVAQQYNSVKESVSDALDWREQYRRRPVAWTVGALGVGLVVGYSLGGAIGGGGDDDDDRDYPDASETDAFARTGQNPGDDQSAFTDHKSYAAHAHALEGGAYGSSEYAAAMSPAAPQAQSLAAAPRPSYSSGYEQAPAAGAAEEEDKPGLLERVKDSGLVERFKETRAYDRLQEEVSDLGNRFMDELSNAARTIVLPALFNKIKQLVGVDLSNKEAGGASARQAYSSNRESTPPATNASSQGGAVSSTASTGAAQAVSSGAADSRSKFDRLASESTPSGGGQQSESNPRGANYDDRYERESQLYARSENRGFGTQAHGTEGGAAGSTPPATPDDTGRGGNS